MEIKTCEQYVLEQLFEQQNENDRLSREIAELRRQSKDTEINQLALRQGRDLIVATYGGYTDKVKTKDGATVPFEQWAKLYIAPLFLPCGMSVSDFAEEFRPELQEIYQEELKESK